MKKKADKVFLSCHIGQKVPTFTSILLESSQVKICLAWQIHMEKAEVTHTWKRPTSGIVSLILFLGCFLLCPGKEKDPETPASLCLGVTKQLSVRSTQDSSPSDDEI